MNNLPESSAIDYPQDDEINIKDLISRLAKKWPWFLISILFCLTIAFLYGRLTQPVYAINAKVLVNDDSKGGGFGNQAGGLMDLGSILGSKNSVDNEVEILKTRSLMKQVVRDMQLNIVYYERSKFVSRELYESPFKLTIIKGIDTVTQTKLEVKKISRNRLRIISGDFQKEIALGEQFTLKSVGLLKIEPSNFNTMNDGSYFVSISSIDNRVAQLSNQLNVKVSNKQVSIIDIGLSYASPARGEDILNTLIEKYTISNLKDKNAVADSTYKFIKERLNKIASELGDVENEVERFKQKNQLADMSEQGKLLVKNTGEFSTELAKAETQVSVLTELERYLRDENSNKRVFPSSLLPQDLVFSNLMSQYNSLLVERERQLLSVTKESPFVKNIDNQILGLRSDILSNIRSTKNSYIQTRDKLKKQLNAAEGQISGVPQIEKNYLKLARNQQIKQELYVFLMQKAEETAISKTANISIAKIIDPPKAINTPISPKRNVIYLFALIAGILIPLVLIFSRDYLRTTIATKDEISALTSVPIVGEISHNDSSDNLIVANQERSAISEQFRALRTNLSFFLKNKDEKIILITSSMSGEGKSFTAINLANILALAGHKVLMMELDLRKPGLSAKVGVTNDVGFSNYTIDPNIKVDHIIKPLPVNKNMFIVSSGPLPPNPAETLMSEHTPALMEELTKRFDYIIMDAPPIGLVVDAQILANYAHASLYLIRQKVTHKEQLAIVEDLYRSEKMKNLGIVVNDITQRDYSYGYGYGYGYGEYGAEHKKSFFQKLFKIT